MARVRPSASHERRYCAASLQMQETFPETEESESAREGTAVHWVAGECLIAYRDGESNDRVLLAFDYVGKTAPNGIVIDQAMADSADVYIMSVLKVCQARGLLRQLRVEETIRIPRIHATESGGTPDLWIWDEPIKTLDVWDLKHGYSVVEAFENTQGAEYIVGILDQITGGNAFSDPNVIVNFHIVQPRAFHPDGVDRLWSFKISELVDLLNILVSQAALSLAPNPPAVSGPHCKNCTAIAFCQTAQRAATNAIDHVQAMTIEVIPPEQLALHRDILQRSIKAIEKRLVGVNAEIEALIRKGQPVNGLVLHTKAGNLAWSKPDEEILLLADMMQIKLSKEKLITPTQAKAVLDPALLDAYSYHPAGPTKLIDSTTTKAARVFATQTKVI